MVMFKKIAMTLCCVLLFAVVFAKADTWDKRTVVTFSQPVEMPGFVLPAGTYVFKLVDSPWNRHIIQVFSADERHVYGTVLAIPNNRLTPTGDTVIRFTERPINMPEALRAWFYPGDNFGQEFVYPKERARNLAEETHQPVLAAAITPEEKPEEMIAAPVETYTPEITPTPEPTVIAQVEPPGAMSVSELPPELPVATMPQELPKTASEIPLIALMGIMSVALAFALRRIAKTVS